MTANTKALPKKLITKSKDTLTMKRVEGNPTPAIAAESARCVVFDDLVQILGN